MIQYLTRALLPALLLSPGFAAGKPQGNPQDHPQDNPQDKAPQQFDYSAYDERSRATADIDRLLQSFVDEKKTGSVAGFVAKGGKVLYANTFGWKDVEKQVPASLDDYYILMSQTKAVTTVAFMTLVEQGLVSIDDPVSKYFPEIPSQVVTAIHEDGSFDTRPVASPMTFAHLMSHTSGLGAGLAGELRRAEHNSDGRPIGFGGPEPDFIPAGQRTGGGNYRAKYLEEEMRELAKYPLGFDPGSEWDYHPSSNMLGYLIERISGMPLRDYVKKSVLEPLGMHDTDWYFEPEALDRFVKAYSLVDGQLQPGTDIYRKGAVSSEQSYAEGGIGLNGPIGDYAKFCQMLLNKGEFNGKRILKPETVELMTRVNRLPAQRSGDKSFQFGLGFELFNADKKPVPAVSNSAYAWGGLLGTEYIIDPENDMIALFYLNMFQRESLYPLFLDEAYQLINRKD